MSSKLISVSSRVQGWCRNLLMKFKTRGGDENLGKGHHMATQNKSNCVIGKLGLSLTLKFLILFIIFTPVKIHAAASVLLDTATVITDGMKLCDSANKFCVDITRNSSSTSTTAFDTSPSIGNVSGPSTNRVASDQIVILDYDTSTSPTPFALEKLQIANINSLSEADSTAGVRDAYSWNQPGAWTIQGTGGTSPAGAIVSIDRSQTNDVGTFVTQDPDGANDLSIISQFTVLPADANNVLLNMIGEADGHDVVYTLDTPTTTASMYAFNSGGRLMGWSYDPSMIVSLPDLTLVKEVINDDGGTASIEDWTLEANISGGTAEISGNTGVFGKDLAFGTYNLSETAGPSNYALEDISCVNFNTGGTDVSGVSAANPNVTIASGDAITCTFTNDDLAALTLPLPTEMCSATWYKWEQPFVATDASKVPAKNFNPTYFGFLKQTTSLGADMWYAPSTTETSIEVLSNQATAPSEKTSGSISELHYGIFKNSYSPGSTVSFTLTDSAKWEGHAVAVFDSSGNQLARLPAASDVAGGQFIYISAVVSNQSYPDQDPEGIIKPTSSWSETLTFTAPADGLVYTHIITADEKDARRTFTFSPATCQTPKLTLLKAVITDDGGTATPADWTLTATGTSASATTITGNHGDPEITDVYAGAGTYTLSESGPAGYTQTSLACTGAADTDLSDGLTIADRSVSAAPVQAKEVCV